MSEPVTTRLDFYGENLAHARLTELMKLADAAEPFYDWIQDIARELCSNSESLNTNLQVMTETQIVELISSCQRRGREVSTPVLFDGIGRQYDHPKAVYYFFSWLIRDAPVQRLGPILGRAKGKFPRAEGRRIEAEALAKLIFRYRISVRSFDWSAAQEVVVDRLEGSRRSVRGRAAELVVRTAVTVALQNAFEVLDGYGRFTSIRMADGEVSISGETFDVCINLLVDDQVVETVLMPVKTRETEGGGHSNLFTRDIESAMSALRSATVNSEHVYWMAPIIVAESWASDPAASVLARCDFAITLTINPTEFESMPDSSQLKLNEFMSDLLAGVISPKLHSE